MEVTCRVCHKRFVRGWGFSSHVASEYNRFRKKFGRPAKDWEEVVDAYNGGLKEASLPFYSKEHGVYN